MHPDQIIEGLRDELARLDESAHDYSDRKAQIEHEIKETDKLPRPAVEAQKPDVVFDQLRAYLAGLEDELVRSERERRAEITAEIKRVETELSKHPYSQEKQLSDTVTDQDVIEQRKQARAGRRGTVEQARSIPVLGEPGPETPTEAANQQVAAEKEKTK